MDRPLFLIGAARSGTKIIGVTLARHPQLAFWDEPKYVWRHGRHGARDDVRTAPEATPAVRRHIREQFESFTRRAGKPRFLEKTPSNCFRVPFVDAVFPDGLFLHVIRDGRDAAASTLQRWRSPPDDAALWRRLRGFEVPLAALPYYVPDILRELVLRRLRPGRGHIWGPRYPGIADDLGVLDLPTLCAKQWAESARTAARALAALPAERVHPFRYEDFVREPARVLAGITRFAGLPDFPDVDAVAGTLREDRIGAFARLPSHEQRAIEAVCAPAMRELGIA